MPIYEYYCNQCDITFESINSPSDKPAKSYDCPYCESSSERVLSTTSSLTGKKGFSEKESLGLESNNRCMGILEIKLIISRNPDKNHVEKILSEKKPYLN